MRAAKFNSTPQQSPRDLSTKTEALAREIPLATQATIEQNHRRSPNGWGNVIITLPHDNDIKLLTLSYDSIVILINQSQKS